MCPVTHTYAENGDLATSREYMEFDTKADLQGVSLVQSYAYDAVGRTTEVTYKQGETVKEKYTQNYDGRNYITQDSYTDGYGSTAKTLNRTYQYDAIGRLTETGVTNGEKTKTTGYQYDKVGNRLYQTANDGTKTVSTKYTYNALGQLTKTQKGPGQVQNVANWYNEEIYTYDNYGNRTGTEVYEVNEGITGSEKIGGRTIQLRRKQPDGKVRNQRDRGRKLDGESTERIQRRRNADPSIRKREQLGTAVFLYRRSAGNLNRRQQRKLCKERKHFNAGRHDSGSVTGSQSGRRDRRNAYWIYHYDARGSATNLVGAKNGSLYRAEENIYDAFGNEEEIKQSTVSVVNDIKFTGATLDNSGTYYLGSRHYDPNTGRFLQQDTFKGDVYSPWTQNLYTYTSNNPVNYVDPTGHIVEEALEFIGGVIGKRMMGRKGEKIGKNFGKKLGRKLDKAFGLPSIKELERRREENKRMLEERKSTAQLRIVNIMNGTGSTEAKFIEAAPYLEQLTKITGNEWGIGIDKDGNYHIEEGTPQKVPGLQKYIVSIHSHVEDSGREVMKQTGMLHSVWDVSSFGPLSGATQQSYVVHDGSIEKIDFAAARQRSGYNDFHTKVTNSLNKGDIDEINRIKREGLFASMLVPELVK